MATIRKDAFKLSTAEQDAYKNAVTAMIASHKYVDLVNIHTDMTHRMHAMGDLVYLWRFLPWHRAYVLVFETELQKLNKSAFVPYWNWSSNTVPSWLKTFKPTIDGVSGVGKVVNNRNDPPSAFFNQGVLDNILKSADYSKFADDLEHGPHDHGHGALGPPMQSVPTAPCDPIFWMHHAQVDRIWAQWQVTHPGKNPILSGKDADMDPWDTKNVTSIPSINVTNLVSIASLGYSYA
jgi:tyrosinase